uniref:ATP synthase F0 subunit 8 n=1 Tax=Meliboeus sinae TaxID=2946727 RepID=UPI00207ACE1E|nr:ATP synthase F0 subunit 8 [Meliboeus sinae]URN73092.1 ATP synthase F0 subunit 8 [Meliboeus sinae]
MPQMSPMNWLSLLIMFTISFLLFLTMNYFTNNISPKIKKSQLEKKNNINWKW